MPDGISDRMVFLPPMTNVWPALWPPWKRATAAARSVRRSTTLPLPSSPHCVPMMTTNLPKTDPLVYWMNGAGSPAPAARSAHQKKENHADQHAAEPRDAKLTVRRVQE